MANNMSSEEPKWYKEESLNDSELGGMGAADYDVEEEFGLLTNNMADSNLYNETDEWGY